ncbi:hypothetical protein THMIRHAS_24870 [Thiosulfatimonas sediminis]|uniref:Uncharacterized protein n=1 Tax=Thiosulfatimonas sediminis TaxID=2675054 RepID=A0A6F8PYN8_9GAMM|nr:hypothetical protein [Thiosulfatimonas sediminis]BBP47114.1 hypothetical protein THMIRHAS_24870 [Thiosulfatimonas sediminis]
MILAKGNDNSLIKTISKFPWMLLVIAYLVLAEQFDISLDNTIYGYVFITMSIVILFVEMMKSVDITSLGFFMDLFWAVLTVIIATTLLAYLYFTPDKSITFFHWLGYGIILADALLNPFNSFRSALRNFDVGS